jgi:predicted metal-binding membrane protein
MSDPRLLERMLVRDRAVVIALLSLVIAVSWVYLLSGAGVDMAAMEMSPVAKAGGSAAALAAMATAVEWTAGYALVMFFMWWVMMIAMMLPSAAPMILLHAKVDGSVRTRAGESAGLMPTAAFTLGYLLAWGGFSVLAVALQWHFERLGLLSPQMMSSTSTVFAAILLLFAGAYQLSAIKQACLRHCRGPIQFLSRHWRPGAAGALTMGLRHGALCVGCCWGLMALLFFGGIMNLYWIAGLALIVLIEKVMPLGARVSQLSGALLLLAGAAFLYHGLA